jgi:CheY-like chemotaxis protein
LVELHGGRVSAASEGTGKGATFSVELPLSSVVESDPPVAHGRTPRPDPPAMHSLALAGVRVLVVDDQMDARDIIGTILERYGAEVRVAESSVAALKALTAQPFDVLVSDIGMPVEDGYELIKSVRNMLDQPEVARMPAVALTAYARSEDERRSIAAGYDIHVTKPIDPDRLVSAVMEMAGRAK